MDIVVTGWCGYEGSRMIYEDIRFRNKLLMRYSEDFFGGRFLNLPYGVSFGANSRTREIYSGQCSFREFSQAVDNYSEGPNAGSGTKDSKSSEREISQSATSTINPRKVPHKNKDLKELPEGSELEKRVAASRDGGVLAALWQVLRENKCGAFYSMKDIPILQQTVEICETFELNPYRLYAPGCRVWLSRDTESAQLRELSDALGLPFAIIGYTAKDQAIRRTDTPKAETLRKPVADELWKLFPGSLYRCRDEV